MYCGNDGLENANLFKFISGSARNNAVCVTRLKVNNKQFHNYNCAVTTCRVSVGSLASLPTGSNIKENHAVTDLLRSSHKTN